MATETPAEGRLACAARARRRNLVPRMTAGALLALMASRLIGWEAVTPWIGVYAIAQMGELWAWSPVTSGESERLPIWRAALGCLAISINAAAFSAICIPLWILGGSLGGICSAFVLTAAIVNAVVVSPASRVILAASLGPQFAYVGAMIYFMRYFGASPDFEKAGALGGIVFCAYSILLWRMLEKTREAEAAARVFSSMRHKRIE